MVSQENIANRSTVLFLGDSGVGKSTFTNAYSCTPQQEIEPSLAGDYQTVKIKDQQGKEQIFGVMNTVGKKEYRPNIKTILRTSPHDIYFIAFDLSNKTSFKNVRAYIALLEEYIHDPLIVIIANKSDAKSAITVAEFKALEAKTKLPVLKASAKQPESIKAVFLQAHDLIKKHQEKKKALAALPARGFFRRHFLKITLTGFIFVLGGASAPLLLSVVDSLLLQAAFFVTLKGIGFIGLTFFAGTLVVGSVLGASETYKYWRRPTFIDAKVIEAKEFINKTAFELRMVFVGSQGAGKTSLIKSIAELPTDKVAPTAGAAFQRAKLKHKNQWLKLAIKDLSGDHAKYLKACLPILRQACDVYVIAFDVTKKRSYDLVVKYVALLRKLVMNPLILIAATKMDDLSNRVVTDTEINNLKKKTQLPIVKTSIKNKKSVEDLFFYAHDLIVGERQEKVIHPVDMFFRKHGARIIFGGFLGVISAIGFFLLSNALPNLAVIVVFLETALPSLPFFFFTGALLTAMVIKTAEFASNLLNSKEKKPIASSTKTLANAGLSPQAKNVAVSSAPLIEPAKKLAPPIKENKIENGIQEAPALAVIRP